MESTNKVVAPDRKLERLAKQMVLAEVNLSRIQARKPPLQRIPRSWWLVHGPDVLMKARAMKVVTIISLWSKLDRPIPAVQYDVLARDGDINTTLQDAYVVTNVDGRPMGRQACATTAGDMMVLHGQHYFVEPRGFRKLTEAEAQAVMQLGVLETMWGFDRLVKNGLISCAQQESGTQQPAADH